MSWPPSHGHIRLLLGAAAGVVLLATVIAQVDLGATARMVAAASLPMLGLAVSVVLLDLLVRALRWQVLLRGTRTDGRSPFHLALAYLGIGYLANQLLPVRTGDLARAYLAGRALRLPFLTTFGTIVVERLADAATILALAVLSSLIVVGVTAVHELAAYALAVAGLGLLILLLAWWLLARTRFSRSRLAGISRVHAERVMVGMRAVRSLRGGLAIASMSLAAAATAAAVAWLAAAAVGLSLTPAQAVLFMSGITLALALPAAPGSLGTYEFAGVVVLTALGFGAEQALAGVLLLRVVTTLPAMMLGAVSAWVLHLRPAVVLNMSVDSSHFSALTETP